MFEFSRDFARYSSRTTLTRHSPRRLFPGIVFLAFICFCPDTIGALFAQRHPIQTTRHTTALERDGSSARRARTGRPAGELQLLGRWGEGPAQAVAVAAGYAYLASGTVMSVLDISDLNEPGLVGQTDTGGRALQVVLDGSHAYVAAGPQGLRIFDISNPTEPVLSAIWMARGSVNKILLSGNIAYLAESGQGVRAINISNPKVPFEVGFSPNPVNPTDLERYDDYLYVVSDKQITILNAEPGGRLAEAGALAVEDYVFDLAISGNLLVSADWGESPAYPDSTAGGLHVWSLSDPTHPSELAAINFFSTRSVRINGQYAYFSGDTGLWVYDLSSPAAPRFVWAPSSLYDQAVMDLAISDEIAFVAAVGGFDASLQPSSFQILDVSNPESRRAGGCSCFHSTLDFDWQGNYLYLTSYKEFPGGPSNNGLCIYDISDPGSPVRVGFLRTDDFQWTLGKATSVAVQGEIAVLATESSSSTILSLEDPANPVRIGGADTGRHASVALSGSYLFAANRRDGFSVIDMSNPAAAALVARIADVKGDRVKVAGDRAFVQTPTNEIAIIGISDPQAPVRLGLIPFQAEAFSGSWNTNGQAPDRFAVDGNTGFLATDTGLFVLDVSDPADPVTLATLDLPSYCVGVLGGRVYVAALDERIHILDLGSPQYPELVSYRTFGFALEMDLVDSYAYILREGGITANDASDLGALAFELGRRQVIESHEIGELAIGDTNAFLSEPNGVAVLDVSNPARPALVGRLEYPQPTPKFGQTSTYAAGGVPGGLLLLGNVLYQGGGVGFHILDVSSPSSPVEVGGFRAQRDAVVHQFATAGRYAYLAESWALEIVDVSDPLHPVSVGTISDSLIVPDPAAPQVRIHAKAISLVGKIACLSDPSWDLSFIDVSDPAHPVPSALPRLDGEFHATASHGNYLYVIDHRGGDLRIFDLSDPAQLRLAGSCPAPAGVTGMAVSETRLYASGSGKVHIFDVQSSASPRWITAHVTAGTAEDVRISGGRVFVADGPSGVSIYQGR